MQGLSRRVGWMLLAAVMVSLNGCGYRMGEGPCHAFVKVRTVAVPLFQNLSHEPFAEDVFTRAFRGDVRSLPCVSLARGERAEAVLRGTVLSVDSYPVGVDRSFRVLEYGMRAAVSLSLETSESGEILWETGRLEEEVRFYATRAGGDPSDPMLLQENRRDALIRLAQRMSRRAMDGLLLGYYQALPPAAYRTTKLGAGPPASRLGVVRRLMGNDRPHRRNQRRARNTFEEPIAGGALDGSRVSGAPSTGVHVLW